MPINKDIFDKFKHVYNKKQDEINEIQQKLNTTKKQAKAWADLLDYICKEWSIHTLKQLKKIKEEQQGCIIQDEKLLHNIDELINEKENYARETMFQFPAIFERECNTANISIDRESRHPEYTFEKGFITLIINEANYTAKISDYEGKLAELSLDIPAVIEVLKREHARLFSRNFDNKIFLENLRKEYLEIIKEENKTDGEGIQIREIASRMKEKNGLKIDEFLVDLSKLAFSEDTPEIDGKKLDLQQIRNTNQGILIPGAEERGYIEFIVFKERQKW
jgi:hypothetical protein